ncbi:unnamed protein product [Didymodactylos carnosus]|uniref:Uncharacterized protein n=1 Tax=Didymodactylos carnosus TaxID=1234261 RepID=A0A815XI60_9BILA|nr:unnamed protein product [Didymodactylos carnosus]CAF1584671.1 unnamed protein product [Didymodactylos carnosus]CAF4385428.1 unnamed protein product [Didymodactylos carnosus]CAF4418991.1 unnamed protein product [Didymodactylos carnosus]
MSDVDDDFEILTVESPQPFEIIDVTDLNTDDKQPHLLVKSDIKQSTHTVSSPVTTTQVNAATTKNKKLINSDKLVNNIEQKTPATPIQKSTNKTVVQNEKIPTYNSQLKQQQNTTNEQLELLKKKDQLPSSAYLPKRYGTAADIPHGLNDGFDLNTIIDKSKTQTSNYLSATNNNNDNILDLIKKKNIK